MQVALTPFAATLPAVAVGSTEQCSTSSSAVSPVVEHPHPLRILVVEDDTLIGMLLGDMLEVMGYQVCAIEATEGGAVAAAAQWAPDLMIVDVNLHEGNGISAVDQILVKGFVPHVFVTGDLRGVTKIRPAAVVISKPFTEAMLENAIALARKSA